MTTVYCGSDTPIDFTLNQSNGDPLDLGTVAQILVIAYLENGNARVQRWSLTTVADHEALEITNASSGQFRCLLQADATKDLPEGKILADIKIKIEDTDYDDGDFEQITGGIYIGHLTRSPLSRK